MLELFDISNVRYYYELITTRKHSRYFLRSNGSILLVPSSAMSPPATVHFSQLHQVFGILFQQPFVNSSTKFTKTLKIRNYRITIITNFQSFCKFRRRVRRFSKIFEDFVHFVEEFTNARWKSIPN